MTKSAWQNRILGEAMVDPEQLLANPLNHRIHTKLQQEALTDILGRIGWIQRVVVNQRTGHVVDGHLRVTLAMRRDEQTIPVSYVDLDEEEEKFALAVFDAVTGLAVPDVDILQDILKDVDLDSPALAQMMQELIDEFTPEMYPEEGPPGMELMPDEKYDYVLLTFTKKSDFDRATEVLGLERRMDPRGWGWARTVGLCRVIAGPPVIDRLEANEIRDPEPRTE